MTVATNNDLLCTIALAALENVIDPEIGLNVVHLGLIYEIAFNQPGPGIAVTMTLTTPHCPMGESITGSVERALQQAFAGAVVLVNLIFDPPWSHDRISATGKEYLSQ
jgi:metal-sulfur cluster biosynthetic enzyme